jgi:bifunctional non-homologous end joining protein LigD
MPSSGKAARPAPDDSLTKYRAKRNFNRTPEPAGGGESVQGALQFVIQKHWASRLHYDLRLELDGTMKSWAVPKGPSFDPKEKRMAVQVEDHPIAYNTFEGQIPAKQYGAGRVIVWDKGVWHPVGDAAEGYREGKLKFMLVGHKLVGHWTLVRMRGRGNEKQPAWLLIKEHDEFERAAADFSVVDAMPDSVAELPVPGSAPAGLSQGRKAALPDTLAPQLATLVEAAPPNPEDWVFELKFDGYRLLARVEKGKARLFTRAGNDWTSKMPALAKAIAALPIQSGWLDGEILMLDTNGVPDFQALQNAFDGSATQQIVYAVFDLPFFDGQDLRQLPVTERREQLRLLIGAAGSPLLRFSEAFDAKPQDLVASACKIGFEGVIGKRRDSVYQSRRSADWIKLKCRHRQEFVIGGYTDPQGGRTGLGSLLLGVHDASGALQYAGKVGTGFTERSLAVLKAQLTQLTAPVCPFAEPRSIGKKGVHWVEPRLLAEVSFAEWTASRRIRHSVFHGLRSDKPVKDIVKEEAAPAAGSKASASTKAPLRSPAKSRKRMSVVTTQKSLPPPAPLPTSLRVSHADRVIDEESGLTKLDLVRYYALVAPLMMEHLADRPVALVRAPTGVGGELFFQKHQETGQMPGIAQLNPTLYVGHPPLLEVVTPEGLLSAAQMNGVEFHTWNARKDRIDRPDRMTFDLDPGEGVSWAQMQEAAQLVRVLLQELGLPAFLKTSGGKGLHVVVPLKRLHGWDTVKGFSQAIVDHLARTIPQRFVAKSGPKNRIGKIFADYLRNGWGATTVSAWSARARPGLGISVPVTWEELEAITSSAHWTVANVQSRLSAGNAPWAGYGKAAVSISAGMKKLGYERPVEPDAEPTTTAPTPKNKKK